MRSATSWRARTLWSYRRGARRPSASRGASSPTKPCTRDSPSSPPPRSARPPAGSCATSATGWSSSPRTRPRWPPRSCGCATTPHCAPGWRVTPYATSPPTLRTPGRPASPPPSPRSACRNARPDPFMRRLLLTLTFTFALLAPATARAGGAAVIRDCTDDGRLEGHYTQRDLRDALSSIPSDVDEYTNCRDVIRRAAFSAGAGGGGKGGGSAGAPGGAGGGSGSGGGSAGGE